MFFLFYPNAAYPLSFLLFPVTKVIHVPGCCFIHNETFIVHSAAFAMFLWDNESSVMSFVPGFFVCSCIMRLRMWQNLGAAGPFGVPWGGACFESGLLQPIWFLFLWFFKAVTFNMPQLSTLKKMQLCSKGTLWLIRKCLSWKAFLLLFGVPSMW